MVVNPLMVSPKTNVHKGSSMLILDAMWSPSDFSKSGDPYEGCPPQNSKFEPLVHPRKN